jgi:amino acid transporter
MADDTANLHAMGYAQELSRQLGGFSNFALSFSIICILSGGVTSFHLGFCSVGGASIGLGWPLVGLFALAVAAAMGQLASAFPTAGGLYHWAAILGGSGWGWITAWFNLVGLITVLAAINVGSYQFALDAFELRGLSREFGPIAQVLGVIVITGSQAIINHLGIGLTGRLTDFSGYWILAVTAVLTVCLLVDTPRFEPARLVSVINYSGSAGGGVWLPTSGLALLFAQGLLLPAYTITGFDASAHAAEETVNAATNVPWAIVRAVGVSSIAGWILLSSVVLAAPNLPQAAAKGEGAFLFIIRSVLPSWLVSTLMVGIVGAQYFCGLAAVTSASRMAFAFARDGGLPWSAQVRWVCPQRRSPAVAIWAVAIASVVFTIYTPVYATITAVCTIFLYISYVVPIALGAWAYGQSWTAMGPWDLGRWYRPLAWASVTGCVGLILIAMQPPHRQSAWVVAATMIALSITWFSVSRRKFHGPPAISASLAIRHERCQIAE